MARALIEFDKRTMAGIVKGYQKGRSSSSLAQEHGVSTATVLRLLREQGVEIRPKGRRPNNAA